jgi:CheY-like chemotaxis protein
MNRPIEILLVEDNPGDVRLAVEGLKEAGIRNNLHVVSDGVEAMTFLRRQRKYTQATRPDVILLDLNLPRKDGREVLAEIKEDPDLRHIPVVVLTESDDAEDVIKTYGYIKSYLFKPPDFIDFITICRDISLAG